MTERAEFTTLSKLKAMARYIRCPGVIEIKRKCGNRLGALAYIEFDHIKRCEIEPDNSPENCRPLCHECHAIKTILDAKSAAKGRRIRGENKPKESKPIRSAGFQTNRDGGWRKKLSGGVLPR